MNIYENQVNSIPMDGKCMFDTMGACVVFYVKYFPSPEPDTLHPKPYTLSSGFRVQGSGFRVQGPGSRGQGSGSGCRVPDGRHVHVRHDGRVRGLLRQVHPQP